MHRDFKQQITCSFFNTGTSRFHANICTMIGWGPCEKAAVCQLSCNMSAQLNCTLPTQLSAHMQFVSSAATVNSAVSSGGTVHLSCHLQLSRASANLLGDGRRFRGRVGIVHCTKGLGFRARLEHYSAKVCFALL